MSQPNTKLHMDFAHRLQQGDYRAWKQFVAEWGPRLYNYLRYNLPTMADVDALLPGTMDAVVKSIAHYHGNASFQAFVYSIAFREVAYFYHQRRHSDTLAILEAVEQSQSDPTAEVEPIHFYKTLAQLPDQSRQAMLLRYRMGFSVDEVAHIVGQSYNATCSLLRQGQRQFGIGTDVGIGTDGALRNL